MTTEQKAWQLHEFGVTYSELVQYATKHDCSVDEATEQLWKKYVKL